VKCAGSSNPKYLSWDDLSITVPCQLNQITVSMSSNSQTLCTGQAVTLTATGADTYSWSNGANGSSIVVSPGGNSTFGVTGTSSLSGCSNTASQQLTVYQSPAVSISANPDTICAGGTATLIAIGAGSYVWSTGGTNYYTFVNPVNTTTYSVIGFNSNCETTATTTIQTNPLPSVSITSSGNALACKDDLITLTGNGAGTYTWVSSNGPVNVVPSLSFILSSTISYTLYGSDNNGCENSAVLTQSASACTGLTESANLQLQVYPNPTNGVLKLTVHAAIQYRLYDITGRLMTEGVFKEGTNVIDLTAFPAGMYNLNLISETTGRSVKIIRE
jgi:hypothetical protein